MKCKNMQRTWKVTSCVVAAALACGGMSMMAYGAGRENAANAVQPAAVERIFEQAAENPLKANDETVYVIASADGGVETVIASDWFTGQDGSYGYRMEETEGALPVEMRVRYLLDGREITPEEAVGASGLLTIRFEFQNCCQKDVEINGKQESMYMPFAAFTGMVLDGGRVSDVKVENGRLLSDGERILVAGMALPGLKENLEMEAGLARGDEESLARRVHELEIPQYIEVTARVTDFQMESTYTIVTNELFSEADTGEILDMDGLQGEMDRLKDAMRQLTDGADRLYDGLGTLSEKSGELIDGIGQLYDGGARLSEGSGTLREGAASLYAGTGDLTEGLSQLQANSDALTGGARQVFDTLLATAGSQLKAAGIDAGTLTVENYGEVLNGILASLEGGAIRDQISGEASAVAQGKVEEAVRANTETIRSQVRDGVHAAVLEQVLQGVAGQTGVTLSAEQYAQLAGLGEEELGQLIAAGQVPAETPALIATVTAMTGEQMASDEVKAQIEAITEQKIQELIAQNMQSGEVLGEIQAGVDSAASGAAGQINALKGQLDSYQAFYQGVLSYTAGVSQAADGAARLRDGAGQLSEGSASLESGASELLSGIGTLKDGSGALVDGVTQLKDGAGELADGLRELDEEGIRKLACFLEEDVRELADRVKATLDLSKEYSSLAAEALAEDEHVRFIYKTGAVK